MRRGMPFSLFRQEAIDYQRFRIWGEVAIALPKSYALVTGFIAVSVLATALFIASHSYARKEHAAGFLVPTEGIAKIMPPRSGSITNVNVTEGQHVERGAPLLTVSDAATSDRGENIDEAKTQRLREQRDHLKEQVELERRKSDAEEQRLQSQIEGARGEIAALTRQQTIQTDRIEIARRQVTGAVELAAKGYLSQVELRRRQDAHLAEMQSASSLAKELAGKQAALSQLQNTLEQLPISTAQRVSQLEASIAELEVRLKEIEGQRGYLLSAPITGRVSALQAWVGKLADPKIPILSIIPDGDVLEAELMVPARAIGFVAPGQTVHISYDAFPFQQFGFARGTILIVSHTLLKPEEFVGPALLREPSYRVAVALERQTIRAYGVEFPLEPDLQLQADIQFERRTLLAWILDPVLSAWERS
jgi:membrane fusion protein